jgi:hypothetical protein
MEVINNNSVNFFYYLFAGTTATRQFTEKAQKYDENKYKQKSEKQRRGVNKKSHLKLRLK